MTKIKRHQLIVNLAGVALMMSLACPGFGQSTANNFAPIDTFNRTKFWSLAALGSGIYGAATIGLHAAWYKDNPRTSFHLFNDWGEWRNMDKLGHAYTAYFEADLCYRGARWTGMPNKGAAWTGAAAAFVMQTTVEMLDAYSTEWGFSLGDMGFNLIGLALFTSQQIHWKEQRIRIKMSSHFGSYPARTLTSVDHAATSLLSDRTDQIFGTGLAERFLKDYNAQSVWLSFNLHSFWPESKIPEWLNIALGYSGENLFGGFSNEWTSDGKTFALSSIDYPRGYEWYLSPDIDLTRIKTNSKVVRTALTILNIFKIPGPALEINSRGKVLFKFLYL